jgi:CheY-like chemotaxis protein
MNSHAHEVAAHERESILAAIRLLRQYPESFPVGVSLTFTRWGNHPIPGHCSGNAGGRRFWAVWEAETVLLAQHDPRDVLLTALAFATSGLSHSLQIATDGNEAIGYLSRRGRFRNRRRYSFPVLMLLDLMLPKITGLKFLEWKEHRSELQNLPVVALTATPDDPAVGRAMELGAVSCLTKPPEPEALRRVVEQFDTCWLTNPTPNSEISKDMPSGS